MYAECVLLHHISSKALTLISQKKELGKLQDVAVTKALQSNTQRGKMPTDFWSLASEPAQSKAGPAQEESLPWGNLKSLGGFSMEVEVRIFVVALFICKKKNNTTR